MTEADPPPGAEDPFYLLDNVHLTSVGVDIGSSTSHLIFSRLHLRRETLELSSRFRLVSRTVLWQSPVLLTPYLPDGLIDSGAIAAFTARCHADAGIDPSVIDTGAVILTGEALKRRNARALADAVASGSGDFVCVTAGHNLEALLSAYGSGSVEASQRTGGSLLCVDIGGGTTKLALIRAGEVVATAAIEVGGRIVAWDADRRLTRVAPVANALMADAGLPNTPLPCASVSAASLPNASLPAGEALRPGDYFGPEAERSLAAVVAAQILAVPAGNVAGLRPDLVLTEPVWEQMVGLDGVTFSGGVSEYVFDRDRADYGDLGRAIGEHLREAIDRGVFGVPVLDPGQGIRATVIGASQCSVQVTGSTVAVRGASLPLRNLPVVHPAVDLAGDIDPFEVAAAIRRAVKAHDLPEDAAVALALRWAGPPSYPRLRALGEGIVAARPPGTGVPAVILLDRDLSASLGALLADELAVSGPLICLDNLEFRPLDYVDIGPPIWPPGVLPVVIKSLLFGSSG
ncbi:ethanolamine ammonia-lyase reactivating factor EutA [Rugosimonospora africana]|uniref:Reactivating factor for ethanolamine ammonia lyase n=1 Tax=Rugosimonospora africana TaxID=556532 RepID=A0A8J3R024_9ACTN|nr:ethanolamine ammonia-lyase reactivating factor EutA [Rugosimonospora africana]GIH17751.1 reactivating factor for ethanolamine ammonia lyase [Rugosimonospora africana]